MLSFLLNIFLHNRRHLSHCACHLAFHFSFCALCVFVWVRCFGLLSFFSPLPQMYIIPRFYSCCRFVFGRILFRLVSLAFSFHCPAAILFVCSPSAFDACSLALRFALLFLTLRVCGFNVVLVFSFLLSFFPISCLPSLPLLSPHCFSCF